MFGGAESGPPLTGSGFLTKWTDKPVGDLYDKISTTMPPLPGQPGTLPPGDYADVVAAILKANRFAPGSSEIGTDEAYLKGTKLH